MEEDSCVERVKPHTDPTDITILAFEEGPDGLQVLPDGEGRPERWVDVAPVPGALLVNLGDVMRFWTNDTWRSTRHRVVLRRRERRNDDGAAADDDDVVSGAGGSGGGVRHHDGGDRMSLVFFHMPNYDAVIDCDDVGEAVVGPGRPRRYPPFRSGERSHFAQLLRNEKGLPDRQTLREDNSRGE